MCWPGNLQVSWGQDQTMCRTMNGGFCSVLYSSDKLAPAETWPVYLYFKKLGLITHVVSFADIFLTNSMNTDSCD